MNDTYLLYSIVWILIGVGLIFVNEKEFNKLPFTSLLSPSVFKWGIVLVLIVGGFVFLLSGLGWF